MLLDQEPAVHDPIGRPAVGVTYKVSSRSNQRRKVAMRLLRVLSSQHLPCGCLVGVYERFDGHVVGIVDEKGDICHDAQHRSGRVAPLSYPLSPDVFRLAAAATTELNPTNPTRFGNT